MKVAVFLGILVLLELGMAFLFIRGLLTGAGDNFLLGTILGAEFLILALAMIFYILVFVPPRVIAEDRDEGLLW
jgi:hypothetical protein